MDLRINEQTVTQIEGVTSFIVADQQLTDSYIAAANAQLLNSRANFVGQNNENGKFDIPVTIPTDVSESTAGITVDAIKSAFSSHENSRAGTPRTPIWDTVGIPEQSLRSNSSFFEIKGVSSLISPNSPVLRLQSSSIDQNSNIKEILRKEFERISKNMLDQVHKSKSSNNAQLPELEEKALEELGVALNVESQHLANLSDTYFNEFVRFSLANMPLEFYRNSVNTFNSLSHHAGNLTFVDSTGVFRGWNAFECFFRLFSPEFLNIIRKFLPEFSVAISSAEFGLFLRLFIHFFRIIYVFYPLPGMLSASISDLYMTISRGLHRAIRSLTAPIENAQIRGLRAAREAYLNVDQIRRATHSIFVHNSTEAINLSNRAYDKGIKNSYLSWFYALLSRYFVNTCLIAGGSIFTITIVYFRKDLWKMVFGSKSSRSRIADDNSISLTSRPSFREELSVLMKSIRNIPRILWLFFKELTK